MKATPVLVTVLVNRNPTPDNFRKPKMSKPRTALPPPYFLPAAGTLMSSLYFASSDGAQMSSRIF